MKYIISIIIFFTFFTPVIYAQFITVNFDVEKNYFNEGQPLPSEKAMMFTGAVPEGVNMIEINILPAKGKNEKDVLYTGIWKNTTNNQSGNYSLAINYKLRSSEEYDFKFRYFKAIPESEINNLTNRIINQLNAYLDASIILHKGKIELAKSDKKMRSEMQSLVNELLTNYRNLNNAAFEGFSTSIEQKLESLDKLEAPDRNKDSMAVEPNEFLAIRKEELRSQIAQEVELYMYKDWSIMTSTYYVDNYETEQKKGSFSVNVGYGGVYLSGNIDDFTYGAAPYAGLSFPLSNSTLAPRFLRNSSLTVGAFFDNFEDEDGTKISGVIVNRPIYVGLDYKLFQFVRFNAGATFLESRPENVNGGPDITNEKNSIFIRPFVGLSAKIDLSLTFGQ